MDRVLARERRRLAIDATYLANPRDTFTPMQSDRLSRISESGGLHQSGG